MTSRFERFSCGRRGALAASVLLLILGAYRILTFIPQPFDSPGTLRPILRAWFSSFVKRYPTPEQAQQAWGTYCIVALLIPAILVFWNYFYRRSGGWSSVRLHNVVSSRILLFIAIALCLLVCRFPFLLANEINPDETFFIAAAEKLFKDPIFFRAVDFATSGPLNVYPLMIPAVFGISPDYVSTRLIALLIILASIYVVYRALALLTDDAAARIAILPAAGAFAVLKFGDFLPYSSEHVSFLLLAMAVYACVRTFHSPQSHAWTLAGLGLLTAAAFLAKMQAVPILICVALVAIAYVYRSGHARRWWRPSLLFGVGLAPLLLANAIVCVLAGVWHDFWMEYIAGNYHYVQSHGALTSEVQRFADFALGVTEIRLLVASLLAVLVAYVYQRLRRDAASDHALFLQTGMVGGIVAVAANWLLRAAGAVAVSYTVMIALLILPGSFVLLYRKRNWDPDPVRWFGFVAGAVLAAAAAVAYVPHRLFGHYLLLLVLPIAIATAWPVVGNRQEDLSPRRDSRLPFLLVFAALTLACQLFELGSPDYLAFAALPSTVRAPESKLIEALTQPAGRIAVWGWNGRPYVGAGRVAALKDLSSGQLFLTGQEVRAYYRAGYLSGLERHRPELLVDAVDTSLNAFSNRKAFGFEVIPEIDSFIRLNYVRLPDAYGQRFYIRRDLAWRYSPRHSLARNALTPLWRVGDPPPLPHQAQLQVRRDWIEITPASDDPQLLFEIGPSLGRFRTVIVRAWFEKLDRIDAFFGKQVDGRGVNGIVPLTGQWLDVYLNMSQNPFWEDEHGTNLRFDPVSSAGPDTSVRIAGIWGSTEAASAIWPEVQFFPVPPSEVPGGP